MENAKNKKKALIITEEMAEYLLSCQPHIRKLYIDAALAMQFSGKYGDALPEWCREWLSMVRGAQEGVEIRQKKKRALRPSEYRDILAYLNRAAGRDFRLTASMQDRIDARIREGACIEDFYHVIDNKAREWAHDAKMRKYLRPETLFGTKFETYRNDGEAGTFAESSFDTDDMFEAALARSYEGVAEWGS